MSDDARGTASTHSTKQEVEKSPRTHCRKCGLSGVSTMVKDGACTNVGACDRRQRQNEKRQPATEAASTPKKGKNA